MNEIKFEMESVKIEAEPRKLKRKLTGKWHFELDPVVVDLYAVPYTRWERICNWFKDKFSK